MRNKKLIESFLEQEGINFDEPFIAINKKKKQGEYKISIDENTNELIVLTKNFQNDFRVFEGYQEFIYILMFDENYEIKPIFKPESSDEYYYIDLNGHVQKDIFIGDKMVDNLNYIIGNCFKTEHLAYKNMDKILKILRSSKPLL